MKKNREVHRCPTCRSMEIYKRIWSKVWADKSKIERWGMADKFSKRVKKYRCMKCKSEFDVPLVENP